MNDVYQRISCLVNEHAKSGTTCPWEIIARSILKEYVSRNMDGEIHFSNQRIQVNTEAGQLAVLDVKAIKHR